MPKCSSCPCDRTRDHFSSAQLKKSVEKGRKCKICQGSRAVVGTPATSKAVAAVPSFVDNVLAFCDEEIVFCAVQTYTEAITGSKASFGTLTKMAVAHGDLLPARPTSFKNLRGWEDIHVIAQYLLGKIMTDHKSWVNTKNATKRDVASNLKAGMKFWETAAARGLGLAAAGMGLLYCTGRKGLQVDFALGLQWYRQAWGLCTLPEAAYNLGVIHGFGYGVPEDGRKAKTFYQAAADVPRQGGKLERLLDVLGPNNEGQDVYRSQGLRNAGFWDQKLREQSGKGPVSLARDEDEGYSYDQIKELKRRAKYSDDPAMQKLVGMLEKFSPAMTQRDTDTRWEMMTHGLDKLKREGGQEPATVGEWAASEPAPASLSASLSSANLD